MVAGGMRYVKRNCWCVHGPSLAALPRAVNVAARIHLRARPSGRPRAPASVNARGTRTDQNLLMFESFTIRPSDHTTRRIIHDYSFDHYRCSK